MGPGRLFSGPQSSALRAGKILTGLGISMRKNFTQLEGEFLKVKLSTQSSAYSPSLKNLEPPMQAVFMSYSNF